MYYWLAFNRRGYALLCCIPSPIAHGLCHTASVHLSGVRSSYFPHPGTAIVISSPIHGHLITKRDTGFMGSACTIRVFVDRVPVADLAPSEKVELFLPLGEYVVDATPTDIFCGGGTSEAAVVVRPESQKILRIADLGWPLGESFVVGTKKIWWWFFCVDCLPVLGQLMLVLVRFARPFGRLFPSYRSPMLCLPAGPFSIVIEIPMSCSPAHLLQVTTMLYSVLEWTVPSIASFGCIMVLRS